MGNRQKQVEYEAGREGAIFPEAWLDKERYNVHTRPGRAHPLTSSLELRAKFESPYIYMKKKKGRRTRGCLYRGRGMTVQAISPVSHVRELERPARTVAYAQDSLPVRDALSSEAFEPASTKQRV